MPKTKKDSEYSFDHCCQRFKERYDRELTIEQYNKLNDKIKKWIVKQDDDDEFIIISKDIVNKTNTSYIIEHVLNDGLLIYFVFETERNTITTFLPVKSVKKKLLKKS